MKKLIKWSVKACLSGVIAIAIISVFALFYLYTGVHKPNPSGATDFLWEPDQLVIDRKEGNAFLRLDENGFNNLDGTSERPIDFLLMGDSNMEAAHVSSSENVGALLNEIYPEMYTYLIALGGHNIYTCTKNIGNALREFKPTTCVLIDTNTISLDPVKMQEVIDNVFETAPSYDQGILAFLQKYVPGVKLIYKQLEEWNEVETANRKPQVPEAPDQITGGYEAVLDAFLKKSASAAEENDVKLIILYMPQTDIESDGTISFQTDPEMLSLFSKTCESNGIIFVDMTDGFYELYADQHELPYGFVNTRVGKGHMNRYGYRVVAEELADVLMGMD